MITNKSKILVVDDELGPRESLRMILKDEYEVITAANGSQALEHLEDSEFALIILDIRMPGISGIELLKKVKEKAPSTEVVMITAYASVDTATKALRLGALDYLIKPFDQAAVLDVVQKGISRRNESRSIKKRLSDLQLANKSLEAQVEESYNNIQKHFEETINSLVAAVDAKDSYTKGHQERVAELVYMIGEIMGMDEEDLVVLQKAATLHDIGKIGVDESVLRKPGNLCREEYDMVKKHPVIGAEILSPVKFLGEVIPLVLHHHEYYDGSGYPLGLKGEEIPLGARIIAVADAVDAMLRERPYAPRKTVFETCEELRRVSGTQLDPKMVEAVLDRNLVQIYEELTKDRV